MDHSSQDAMEQDREQKEVEVIEIDISSEEDHSQLNASSSKNNQPKASGSKQMLRGPNFRFDQAQTSKLKELFKQSDKVTTDVAGSLALQFGCQQRQIQEWFHHAREFARKPKATRLQVPRVYFKLWQNEKLRKFYDTNKYPSTAEYGSLAKEVDKTHEQVKTWFKHQRSKYIGVERMEPKAATPQTLSPNTSPSLFYEESESIKWRDLQPEEQTSSFEYVYITRWGNAASGKNNSSVGLTNLIWPTEAAETNVRNVMNAVKKILAGDVVKDNKLSCSYRQDVIMDELTCDTGTAVSTGVYCENHTVAAKVKWYFRLRFLAMGTFHPSECLDSLRPAVTELEKVAQLIKPFLAPRNQRWMEFSDDAFKKYIANGTNKVEHPSLDKELVLRFEVKELKGFDFGTISSVLQLIKTEQEPKAEPEAKTVVLEGKL